jgi:hypothetical protein
MKRKPVRRAPAAKKSSWDLKKWCDRCAWCTQKIAPNQEVFGIEIRLRPEAFREFDLGSVQPLLLAASGRTVPMMVARQDSPAKIAGKDALFQLCSKDCAEKLQAALQLELGT